MAKEAVVCRDRSSRHTKHRRPQFLEVFLRKRLRCTTASASCPWAIFDNIFTQGLCHGA